MDENRCTCDEIEYEEHVCPYDEDVNNDPDSMCTCCPFCTAQCTDDI